MRRDIRASPKDVRGEGQQLLQEVRLMLRLARGSANEDFMIVRAVEWVVECSASRIKAIHLWQFIVSKRKYEHHAHVKLGVSNI